MQHAQPVISGVGERGEYHHGCVRKQTDYSKCAETLHTLALRSAAKKAFDAYKKENGSDKKLPRISELNTEYSMLLERKKSSYAEYRETKAEMQDWLVAQKIVQEILKEDEQKKEQMHEQGEENRENSR